MMTTQIELAHARTHEHVLDRDTGAWLSLSAFMGDGDYGKVVAEKRVVLAINLIGGDPRYVCPACEQGMTLASHAIRNRQVDRFYFKHRDRNSLCVGVSQLSKAEICAKRFGHCKEGAAHKQVKAWLEQSLQADPRFSNVDVERRWKDVGGVAWRQPDVQCAWQGERIAFEAQLSTTFLHVIAERMRFYERNGGRLVWLFRDLDVADFQLAEDDIFYSNNRNAFRVTPETLACSLAHHRFALECVWEEPIDVGCDLRAATHRKAIFFDDLTFDVSASGVPRAYYFDYDRACESFEHEQREQKELSRRLVVEKSKAAAAKRDDQLRASMESLFVAFPSNWDAHKHRWPQLRIDLGERGHPLPEQFNDGRGPFHLLMAAYSAKCGRVVGCAFPNYVSLASRLFAAHKDVLWTFSVMMAHYDRAASMRAHGNMSKWMDKVETYRAAWKRGDPDYAPDRRFDTLLDFLFPDAPSWLWTGEGLSN